MSRRPRRPTVTKLSGPLIAAGLGVLVVLVFAGYYVWQTSDTRSGAPSLSVDQRVIDYGNVPDYTEKTFTFTVTNTGTGILRFQESPYIQVLEGCCPPNLSIGSTTLLPGQSTTVTSEAFMMHPGMDGKHDYAVHLITNDPQKPDLVVSVLSNWSQ